ncbi:hypothetical protein M0R45_017232 [Rubus argutus]|uniref:Uncharacterized protein n=1 Tax=Rubus argutus TaxID=59490 RepID=A0AAW1XVK4_RUBAR
MEAIEERKQFVQVCLHKKLLNKKHFLQCSSSLKKLFPEKQRLIQYFQFQVPSSSPELLAEELFHKPKVQQPRQGTQGQILHHEKMCGYACLLAQA